MRIDSSGNVGIDHQQTTKKKGTILRLSLSNLKVLEVYIKMNSIYIPTILVHMIANCNTYSQFIHRLIHTEKTSKYLFWRLTKLQNPPPLTTPAKIIYQLIFFIWAKEWFAYPLFLDQKKRRTPPFTVASALILFLNFNLYNLIIFCKG